MKATDLAKLHEPFPAADVEWRLARAGKTGQGDFWGLALAYITNRAIQDRLDDVCGPGDWRNEYREGPGGGVLCGISIRVEDEWVTKWDGAENTDVEAVKGGLSGAMKRAAVQWGIGRYLYGLSEGWATCYKDQKRGAHRGQTKEKDRFSWDPPALPEWALPGGSGKPNAPVVNRSTGEVEDDAPDELELTALVMQVEGDLDTAAGLGIITPEEAGKIEKAAKDRDVDHLRIAKDWLAGKIKKAPYNQPEQADEAKAKATA